MNGRTGRSTFLIRAATATALVGHWIANVVFDRAQYEGAATDVLARLDDPMLLQAVVGVLGIIALALWDRHRKAMLAWRPQGFGAVLAFVLLQVGLFIGLEGSERLTIEAVAGEQTPIGPFEVGFVAELLVAVGIALILSFMGEAARRYLRPGRPSELVAGSGRAAALAAGHAPATAVLVGAGSVRAPPA